MRRTLFSIKSLAKLIRKLTNFSNFIPFQVLVPTAGIRGFLDASEYGTWLKHFQLISQGDEASKQNVKHFLLAGQVSLYCTIRNTK